MCYLGYWQKKIVIDNLISIFYFFGLDILYFYVFNSFPNTRFQILAFKYLRKMSYELTLPQFINKANMPELTANFAGILKIWPNFNAPGHFRFNPWLYRQIYPELSSLSDQELCRYYFKEGIWHKPLCAQSALFKLLPNYDVNCMNDMSNAINPLCETVKRELLDKPLTELLAKYITIYSENITQNKYKCIIMVQFASVSPIAMDLLGIIKNIIHSSVTLNKNHDILLFVNITTNVIESPKINDIMTELLSLCTEYIITTSVNMGTDIQAYFMMLNELQTHTTGPIISDYILKLHTKNDATCIKQMTNCFRDDKFEKAISVLDAVKTIDILGSKELVMPNYHVHDILQPIISNANSINPFFAKTYNQLTFVAGSAFLSRYQTQVNILNKYQDLIRQSVLLCQYINGWFFQTNSPTHALERLIGGFESQINNQTVKAFI